MVSVNVDVKRMPLGKISKEQVLKGFNILCSIEKAIQNSTSSSLDSLSSEFYSNIPHNFGYKKMQLFTIKTLE